MDVINHCAWGSVCNAGAGLGKFVPDAYGVARWAIYVRPESTVRRPEDLADAEAFAPPGPADDGVDHARMLTLRAETLFATRIQEILTDLNTAAHPKKF